VVLRPRLSAGLPLSWRTILLSLRRKAWNGQAAWWAVQDSNLQEQDGTLGGRPARWAWSRIVSSENRPADENRGPFATTIGSPRFLVVRLESPRS